MNHSLDADVVKVDLVISIVTYNSDAYIEKCLLSIASCLTDGFSFLVCVVDNASTDETRNILCRYEEKFPWIRVILLENNIGFGSANNVAMERYPADFYFLLNADAYFIRDSITPALKVARENPQAGVIGLPLVYPDGTPQSSVFVFSSWHRWLLSMLGIRSVVIKLLKIGMFQKVASYFQYTRNFSDTHSKSRLDLSCASLEKYSTSLVSVDWVSGAAMILNSSFVEKSGGFDENIFLYGEDEDICISALRFGYSVNTIDSFPIAHCLGWGANKFNAKVANYKYKSLKYFIRKNISGTVNKLFMLIFLPFYVYGWRFPRVFLQRGFDK